MSIAEVSLARPQHSSKGKGMFTKQVPEGRCSSLEDPTHKGFCHSVRGAEEAGCPEMPPERIGTVRVLSCSTAAKLLLW